MNSPASRRLAMSSQDFGRMDMVNEYLTFRLPFQAHLGWAIFVFLMNVNEFFYFREIPFQQYIALGSCIILWIVGIALLFVPTYPNFIVPLVFSWAAMGIWVELHNPDEIIEKYSKIGIEITEIEIERMTNCAIATCIEHLVLPMLRFLFHFAENYSLMEK